MHLDHESCLEVTVLKGKGAEVQSFANHVIAERGVRHGHVVYVPAPQRHVAFDMTTDMRMATAIRPGGRGGVRNERRILIVS